MKKLWLIGAGPHAVSHSMVLNDMNVDYKVIGRGVKSAKKFEETTGVSVLLKSLSSMLKDFGVPDMVIISVSFDQLHNVARQIIDAGVKRILIEKPGSLNSSEVDMLNSLAQKKKAEVYIAYNRRHYASVIYALKEVERDGGVLSCNFEFTEWIHTINSNHYSHEVMAAWVIANSSHVIDLAFHFCGRPLQLASWVKGGNRWHPAGSIFSGSGVSQSGVLFSYSANWESAGRWALEILTRHRKFIFRPLEKLKVQNFGEIEERELIIDNQLDIKYKPGLYLQTYNFIHNINDGMCTISEHLLNMINYEKIAGYNNCN